MSEALQKVEIKKVIGPTSAGAAILLGNADKTFVVFIGFHEAAALIRELRGEASSRPLTHDLIQSVFLGFDLAIKQIVISDIVDNAFCATLILEQKVNDDKGEWVGRRNEVRIDARPSDCLVLAMKNSSEIYVTSQVFEQVQDFSEMQSEGHPWLAAENLVDEDLLRPRSQEFTEPDEDEDKDKDTLEQ